MERDIGFILNLHFPRYSPRMKEEEDRKLTIVRILGILLKNLFFRE